MKLWLISQDKNDGYDTFDSAVVAAETKALARCTPPGWGGLTVWAPVSQVEVRLLGEAIEGTEAGVICASFNAG